MKTMLTLLRVERDEGRGHVFGRYRCSCGAEKMIRTDAAQRLGVTPSTAAWCLRRGRLERAP